MVVQRFYYLEDLSIHCYLAVSNVSIHWYLFTQWSMIKDLMEFCLRSTLYTVYALPLSLARGNRTYCSLYLGAIDRLSLCAVLLAAPQLAYLLGSVV